MKTIFQAASPKIKYQVFITQENENKYDVISYVSGKETSREQVSSKDDAIKAAKTSIEACEFVNKVKLKILLNGL